MNPLKVGFHAGVAGNRNGIGDYFKRLDAAGIPFAVKSVGDAGLAAEAAAYAAASGVDHKIVMRWAGYPGLPDDHPDLSKPPEQQARVIWEAMKGRYNDSPELHPYKDYIWFEPTNEIDTNANAAYLGEFSVALGNMALDDGFKVILSGHNAGQPERSHWEGELFEWLKLASENPHTLGISVHEGKTRTNTLNMYSPVMDFYNWYVGRYETIFSVCDEAGLVRPPVFVTEWAWDYRNMPGTAIGMRDVEAVGALAAKYEALQAVFLWNLAGGWEPLPNKLQQLIAPVTELALVADYPPSTPPPGSDVDPGLPREQYHRTYIVAPPGATKEQWLAIADDAYEEKRTIGFSYDDAGLGALERKTAELIDADPAVFDGWYEDHYPGTELIYRNMPNEDLLAGLSLLAPFRVPFKLTSPFNASRSYGKHEGTDYDVLTAASDSKEPVLAMYPGRIVYAADGGTAYGNYIVQRCLYKAQVFFLWMAHMDRLFVVEGDSVVAGQHLGEIGRTGNALGEHVHINLQHQGSGLSGYVVADVRDPAPFISLTPQKQDVYTGPAVTFVAGVDQPASDWYWPTAKSVFDVTGLAPKFHAKGTSHQWYNQYENLIFDVVRVDIAPSFSNPDPNAIFAEVAPEIQKWWPLGQEDFIIFNEPNIENAGKLWNNGTEFGRIFREVTRLLKNQYVGIRLWFSPMSPGPGATPAEKPQHKWIGDALAQGAMDFCYGMTCHSYSGLTSADVLAAQQIVEEVAYFQKRWALTVPLILGEFSVNQPASAQYKARVYKRVYQTLELMPGIQGAYSFTSSWYGGEPKHEHGSTWDRNYEGWLETGIDDAFVLLG